MELEEVLGQLGELEQLLGEVGAGALFSNLEKGPMAAWAVLPTILLAHSTLRRRPSNCTSSVLAA